MSIDEIVNKEKNGPRCFHNGKYHYRSKGDVDKPNVYYCALSDDQCIYFKGVNGKDYCLAYDKGKEQ